MSALDGLREVAEAAHITDGEAVGIIMRDLRAAVAEHAALRAERDDARARVGAAYEEASRWGHCEECPAEDEGACDCGIERLLSQLSGDPEGEAVANAARRRDEAYRAIVAQRAATEKLVAELRADAAAWNARATEMESERDALRAEVSAALGLPPTVGPAPGELARVVRETREALDVALKGACPKGHAVVTLAQADDAARARAELDDAWRAFPSAGAVRGMVPLAEVVAGLVETRAELTQELSALRAAARRVAASQRAHDVALTDLFALVPAEEAPRG